MRIGLSVKIAVMLVGILAAALGLNSLLNAFNFRKTYQETVASRYRVVALDLKQTVEEILGLGIPLAAAENLPATLDQVRRHNPGLRALFVLDSANTIRHASTDGNPDTHPLPPKHADPSTLRPHFTTQASIAIVLPLINNFEQRVGWIVLQYDRAPVEATVAAVNRILLRRTLVTLLVASLLGWALVHGLTRGLFRRIRRMHASLLHIENGETATYAPDPPRDRLDQEFIRFQRLCKNDPPPSGREADT